MALNSQQQEYYRLQGVDSELKRANQTIFECHDTQKRQQDKIQELEFNLGRHGLELQ
jgi:hypothetical protein